MSYDLSFWRQTTGCGLDPLTVYNELNDEHHVEGLVDLPIDAILGRVMQAFPAAQREPNGQYEWVVWISDDETQMFEITWSNQHVRADFRPLVADIANTLVDIAIDFGCAVFDPQTGERFAQPT